MLHEQLWCHLPGFLCCGISIMCTIELQDTGICHNIFCFRSIHKGTMYIDITIKHIVLRILVRTIDTFFGKQHSDFRPCYTTYIRMKINWPADFIFNCIECFARGTDLFSTNRNTTYTFGRTFNQAIDMRLARGPYHHDVIRPMPGCHAHAT